MLPFSCSRKKEIYKTRFVTTFVLSGKSRFVYSLEKLDSYFSRRALGKYQLKLQDMKYCAKMTSCLHARKKLLLNFCGDKTHHFPLEKKGTEAIIVPFPFLYFFPGFVSGSLPSLFLFRCGFNCAPLPHISIIVFVFLIFLDRFFVSFLPQSRETISKSEKNNRFGRSKSRTRIMKR